MQKLLITASALTLLATTAWAQTTPPTTGTTAPNTPTIAQCQAGWKDGMDWTKEQFEAACLKVRQGSKP